jgi:predicted transcriptional regulator
MRTVLMSIRDEPFEAIIEGKKKHEFRRRFYVDEPCQVIFYVSSPVSAICGIGIFDKPIKGDVEYLVEIIKTHSFSSEESLRNYMEGLGEGYALPVTRSRKISPITLNELREKISGFAPPQSYCSFNINKFKNLIGRLNLYETPDEII